MKTVCPHCNQEYDVEENFLQQEVTCSVCNQDFTVGKAKICTDCGTINPAQAFKCRQCGNVLLALRTAESPQRIISTFHKTTHRARVSSAETLSRFTRLRLAFLGFSLTIPVIALWFRIFLGYGIFSAPGVLMASVSVIYVAVIWPALSLISQLANPNVKIVWSIYKKISMGIATLLILIYQIHTIIYVLNNFSWWLWWGGDLTPDFEFYTFNHHSNSMAISDYTSSGRYGVGTGSGNRR